MVTKAQYTYRLNKLNQIISHLSLVDKNGSHAESIKKYQEQKRELIKKGYVLGT